MPRYAYVFYRYYDGYFETFGAAERALKQLKREFSDCDIDKGALNKVNQGLLVTAKNRHKAEVEAFVEKRRLK